MSSLRVVFAGTPDFAATSLTALHESAHRVVGVFTQPDRPVGRGRKQVVGPVKQLAVENHLPVYQPVSLKTADSQAALTALKPDVMVVVAYGLLLPQAVLDIPRLGCVNVHGSLLPRWRGAAPIQRAIEAGDSESGVAIMQMDAGLDTGAVYREARTPITSTTTGGELHDTLAEQGASLLIETLNALAKGEAIATPQPEHGVSYADKLTKAEAELDFTQPATVLAARVRAFNPWPVAWCTAGELRLRLWMATAGDTTDQPTAPGTLLPPGSDHLRIACGPDGRQVINILQAQLPGGRALCARELLNAQHGWLTPGTRLGQPLSGDVS